MPIVSHNAWYNCRKFLAFPLEGVIGLDVRQTDILTVINNRFDTITSCFLPCGPERGISCGEKGADIIRV